MALLDFDAAGFLADASVGTGKWRDKNSLASYRTQKESSESHWKGNPQVYNMDSVFNKFEVNFAFLNIKHLIKIAMWRQREYFGFFFPLALYIYYKNFI